MEERDRWIDLIFEAPKKSQRPTGAELVCSPSVGLYAKIENKEQFDRHVAYYLPSRRHRVLHLQKYLVLKKKLVSEFESDL